MHLRHLIEQLQEIEKQYPNRDINVMLTNGTTENAEPIFIAYEGDCVNGKAFRIASSYDEAANDPDTYYREPSVVDNPPNLTVFLEPVYPLGEK